MSRSKDAGARAAWWLAIGGGVLSEGGCGRHSVCGRSRKIDAGDTAWVLVSSALVLMMTAPGLALFYVAWCGVRTCLPP